MSPYLDTVKLVRANHPAILTA